MFQFTCPEVKNQAEVHRICIRCHAPSVVIKQTFPRSVKDSVVTEATVIRLFCKACHRSFRVYPEGIRRYSARTKRLVFLGVVLYAAGLSFEKSAGFLNSMVGRNLEGFVTIWRDVQVLGETLRRKHLLYPRRHAQQNPPVKKHRTVVGLDGTFVRLRGKKRPVEVAVDRAGDTITIALVDEKQEEELKAFVVAVAKEIGISITDLALVSDDLDTYKIIAEGNNLPHQVSIAGAKRNLKRRLKRLAGLIPKAYIDQLENIFDPPSLDTPEHILKKLIKDPKLWQTREKTPWESYRRIVSDMLRKWQYYTAYLRHSDILLPSTNNKTEQANGRSKVRYPLTRGFKSKGGVLNYFTITQMVGMKRFDQLAKLC